jgi:hypothetical protein
MVRYDNDTEHARTRPLKMSQRKGRSRAEIPEKVIFRGYAPGGGQGSWSWTGATGSRLTGILELDLDVHTFNESFHLALSVEGEVRIHYTNVGDLFHYSLVSYSAVSRPTCSADGHERTSDCHST